MSSERGKGGNREICGASGETSGARGNERGEGKRAGARPSRQLRTLASAANPHNTTNFSRMVSVYFARDILVDAQARCRDDRARLVETGEVVDGRGWLGRVGVRPDRRVDAVGVAEANKVDLCRLRARGLEQLEQNVVDGRVRVRRQQDGFALQHPSHLNPKRQRARSIARVFMHHVPGRRGFR